MALFIRVILGQSIKECLTRDTITRTILASWLLAFIILKNFYCAKLWDLMTFEQKGNKVETIEEFYKAFEQGKMKLIVENLKISINDLFQVNFK